MNKIPLVIIVLMTIMAVGVMAENPPSLTNFHQFYGKIFGLNPGNYELKAIVSDSDYVISDVEYVTEIKVVNQKYVYGYDPTFKVHGQVGDVIDFYLVNKQLGIETSLGGVTFGPGGTIKEKDFILPGALACNDGQDNDGDTKVDNLDPGCTSSADTDETDPPQCDDGRDNDGDTKVDDLDLGCTSITDTDETDPSQCNDGVDNDGDDLKDLADPGCLNDPTKNDEYNPPPTTGDLPQCSDGIDNDGDGKTNFGIGADNDPGCSDVLDPSEKGTIACDDGIDNDGDGKIDYNTNPALLDSGCSSSSDTSELGTIVCDDGIDNDDDGKIDFNGTSNNGVNKDIGCSGYSDNNETDPVTSNTNTGSGSGSGSSSSSGGSGGFNGGGSSTITLPGTCTQSWECGNWGLCRENVKSRICYRVDNCDQIKTQNPSAVIEPVPKPKEQGTCQSPAAPASSTICSSGFKRCLGTQLQQCSTDGKQWNTLTACPHGCDLALLECKEAFVPRPATQQPTSAPKWMYYFLGSALLLAVIILVVFNLVHQKKLAPAKNYIAQCRQRGFSDTQIRTRLVQEGWDSGKISKLMK